MRRVVAIATLTFWEGIRMRMVLVFLVVLAFAVLRLPFALKGDETLAGRLQTFLSYSLSALSVFMSLATIFFSCATLSNEIKTRSLHLVVTKPVSRLEIVIGKWLGVNMLNLLLVVLGGITIYLFASFIRKQPEQFERDRLKVRDVVWTARVAAEPTKPDFAEEAQRYVKERIESGAIPPESAGLARAERVRELESRWVSLDPGEDRFYKFTNLPPPPDPDTSMQIRYRMKSSPLPKDELLAVDWVFVEPDREPPNPLHWPPRQTKMRVGDTHQFLIRASGAIRNGEAAVVVGNPPPPDQRVRMFFEKNGLQLLYKVDSFENNYLKSLLIIYFRLAYLSALGILFGTFCSFPVACFCTMVAFLICLGMPWWMETIGANAEAAAKDPYGPLGPLIRGVLVPVLVILFPDFVYYDGAGRLIDGLYISFELLYESFLHLMALGLLLLAAGCAVFYHREIAEVTV